MRIIKLKDIRGYQSELKAQFSTDAKYAEVSKEISRLLRSVNPFLNQVETLRADDVASHSGTLEALQAARRESTIREELDLEKAVQANKDALVSLEKRLRDDKKALDARLDGRLKTLDDRLEDVSRAREATDAKALLTSNRDIAVAQRRIEEIKDVHKRAVQVIEEEKDKALRDIAEESEKTLETIRRTLEESITAHEKRQSRIEEDGRGLSGQNDQIYLQIKTSYNRLSIETNKKISALKASRDARNDEITSWEEAQHLPVNQAIEQLREAYDQARRNAEESYRQKIRTQNEQFERQQVSYASKKDKIIHDAGETITLLNSKLSSYRESINRDKLNVSREMRETMKNTQSVEEKDRLNRQLTKKLNALDNDLNRQIVRTKRDILNRQREQQRRLFMHDQYHLRQMNHWRLKKTLDDYQKKQDLLKIDLNYQHNMSLFDIETKRIKALRAHHQSMLSMTYRKDMLPLETQLQIAAATQERELNLLANDAHLDIRKSKHDAEEQTLLVKKDRLRAEYDSARANARRKTREQIENITAQLRIAQEKLKRDIRIGEQENRIRLAKALCEKDRQISSDDAAQERALIENDRLYAMLDHEHALFRLEHEAALERLQRGSSLDRFRIRTTYVLSSVRSKTIHATHRADLESRQKECEHLFSVLRMFQDTRNRLRLVIRDLYLLPSHPEVFKTSLGIVTRLIEDFQTLSDQLIDRHKAADDAFYTSVIERLTQSRYAKKREDITRLYDQEIERIESRRQSIVDDIMKMEAEVVRLKSDTEKNRTDAQAESTSANAHAKRQKTMRRHGSDESAHVIDQAPETHHLVSQMQHLEKEINNRHKELLPLSDKIEETALKKQKALNKLEIDLQKETSACKSFEHRTDRIYESVRARMTDSVASTKDFYQRLSSEVYVTETVLNDVLDAIRDDDALSDRLLVESQQDLLDLMTAFYHDQTKTEYAMMRDLSRMTTLLEKGVDATFKVKHKALSNSLSRMTSSYSSRRTSLKNALSKTLLFESATHQKAMSETEKTIRDLEGAIASSEPTLKEQLKIVSDNSEAIAIQVDKDHVDNEALRDAELQKAVYKVDQAWIQSTRDLESLEETIRTRNQLIITRADQQITKHRVQMRQKHDQITTEEHKARTNLEHRMKDFEREARRLGERREESLKNLLKHHRRFRNQSEKQQQRVQRREIRILRKSHQFKLKMLHLN